MAARGRPGPYGVVVARRGSYAGKAATAASAVNRKFVYRRKKRLRALKRNV